ncbi:MAG: hypothetical protein L6R40_008270 [Gallowayella cf. fulva]|nr:MAG: hypothetical protein L6R40_008270 [Xanthomendoza cf. fulva]
MHCKTLLSSAAFVLCATVVSSQATTSKEPAVEAEDVEAVVPTEIINPAQATSIAVVANSFIASVTAAPEYSSVISVLATGIPATAQEEIAKNPESFLLNLLSGSPPPDWATALPPSVAEYVESVAEDAAQLATSDFPDLYTSLSAEAGALETGAPGSGPYVLPTGGYRGSNYTSPRPTGSAAAPGPTPEPFVPGSGASTNVGGAALAVVAAGLGIGALFLILAVFSSDVAQQTGMFLWVLINPATERYEVTNLVGHMTVTDDPVKTTRLRIFQTTLHRKPSD